MKFLREIKDRITSSRLIAKLRAVKNLEIVIAVILALVAAIAYFAVSVKTSQNASETSGASVEMSETEARLAEMISEISGVGKTRVLISTGADAELVGVVVVAEGTEDMTNRVKVIRCIEKATGATVDMIEIFEMEKGG